MDFKIPEHIQKRAKETREWVEKVLDPLCRHELADLGMIAGMLRGWGGNRVIECHDQLRRVPDARKAQAPERLDDGRRIVVAEDPVRADINDLPDLNPRQTCGSRQRLLCEGVSHGILPFRVVPVGP